jgi:hypothetical protein
MTRRRARAAGIGVLLLAAAAAHAAIPSAAKIHGAVARHNQAAGRARGLALDVALERPGAGAPLAAGTLLADPSGRARLELFAPEGDVRRELVDGAARRAGGAALDAGAAGLLPPLALLQAGSGGALATALAALGAPPGAVVLGHEGEHDCYVLGGRAAGAALWVDQETFEAVRIDAGGARFRLGPTARFGAFTLPAWIDVEAPGAPQLRLTVRAAEPAALGAESFRAAWVNGG